MGVVEKVKAEPQQTEISAFCFPNFCFLQTGGANNNNRLARLPRLSYGGSMKTLSIRLPDVLARRIEQESLTRRVSKSDIVRERLDQPGLPPLHDGSLRDILEEGWAAQVPAQPRQFRSPHKQKLAEIIRAKKLHR